MLHTVEIEGLVWGVQQAQQHAVIMVVSFECSSRMTCFIAPLLGANIRVIAFLLYRIFFMVSAYKATAVLEVLQRGYQVLFTDTDVIFLRDPREFIRESYSDYDFAFQAENQVIAKNYSINTGVFYASPTNSAMAALEIAIENVKKVSS